MSLDKGIEHGKEKRQKYYRSKEIAKSCRNHGGCPRCEGDKQYKYKKAAMRAQDILDEWEEYE